VLVIGAMPALGDEISTGGLTYQGVTIVGVNGAIVSFRTPNGITHKKTFSEITGVKITGVDSFNKAEDLMAEAQGTSGKGGKLAKQLEAKQQAVRELTADINGADKEVIRLKAEAKTTREQAVAFRKSSADLTKQVDGLKKTDVGLRGKLTRLREEATKLEAQARIIQRAKKKNWQRDSNQKKNQANALRKQADEIDPVKMKYKATRLLSEARKLQLNARREKDGNKAKNLRNQAKKRADDARNLSNRAKQVSDAATKRRSRITTLASDAAKLKRQGDLSDSKARSLDKKAAALPGQIPGMKEKLKLLKAEVVAIENKIKAEASRPKIKPLQYPAAIRAYEAAAGLRNVPHVKAVIEFRYLIALKKAGWIDEAASKWLVLADRANGAKSILDLCPKVLADKGDARNARAITALKQRLGGIKDSNYQATVKELLGRLLRHEGRTDELVKLFSNSAGGNGTVTSVRAANQQVIVAGALLDKGKHANAAKAITQSLRNLDKDSLPAALMILGKAQLGQAASASGDRKQELMQRAGLSFMRVFTYFRGSSESGEALFLAAEVMATLPRKPNRTAAARAYGFVAKAYPGTPIGQKASVALKRLKP